MNKLNEMKQVVILAAGRSRRMEDLSKKEPKCLLPYKGERVLQRLVRQIKENGIEKIVVTVGYRAEVIKKLFEGDPTVVTVENEFYEEDVNIYSMKLALTQIDGAFAVFEADTILEDALVKYILGSDFEGKSVWFTRGRFTPSQYGGILKSDKFGKITDIRIVASYQDKYKNYSKLSGLMRIGPEEYELFRALINKYASTTVKQYFLNAWIENLKLLPCEEADFSMYDFYTFNKPEEYYQVQKTNVGSMLPLPEVQLVEVSRLKPIESYDKARVDELVRRIKETGMWSVPVILDNKNYLIMDGQHRREAALALGLKYIPAIVISYNDVEVWSLRKEIRISAQAVVKKVCGKGEIYPYKTVKHKFNFAVPDNLKYELDSLR